MKKIKKYAVVLCVILLVASFSGIIVASADDELSETSLYWSNNEFDLCINSNNSQYSAIVETNFAHSLQIAEVNNDFVYTTYTLSISNLYKNIYIETIGYVELYSIYNMQYYIGVCEGQLTIDGCIYYCIIELQNEVVSGGVFASVSLLPMDDNFDNMYFVVGKPFITENMYQEINDYANYTSGNIYTAEVEACSTSLEPSYQFIGSVSKSGIALYVYFATNCNRLAVLTYSNNEYVAATHNLTACTAAASVREWTLELSRVNSDVSYIIGFDEKPDCETATGWTAFRNISIDILNTIGANGIVTSFLEGVTTPTKDTFEDSGSYAIGNIKFGIFDYVNLDNEPLPLTFNLDTGVSGSFPYYVEGELKYRTYVTTSTGTSVYPFGLYDTINTAFMFTISISA